MAEITEAIKSRPIVMFYNETHAPYLLQIWPRNIPQIKWLLAYIAEQAVEQSVWRFTYTAEDGKFEVLLRHGKGSKRTFEFSHRLHTAAQIQGLDTVTTPELGDVDRLLRGY